jgi:predicted nucleic acid-binding protein
VNLLIDTNVVLDILLNRQPHYANAMQIFGLTRMNLINCYISASSVTDIFYISQKQIGKKSAKEALKKILTVFLPATVTDNDIYRALSLNWDDFEDSVQFVVGDSFSAEYIVTRNIKDYSLSTIPAITPEQFIKLFSHDDEE